MTFCEALEEFKKGKVIRNRKMNEICSFVFENGKPHIISDYGDGDVYKNEWHKHNFDLYIMDLLNDDWEVVA